ncbi:nitric oxide-associated protein 1 [Neodiprion fabricii]|uniref:nitric oxide-associated protein 1 n=1 Tax=Neodiprion fabricii TaxID=2872261 RepID=UPI001ED8FFDB|nr:nitric oxide-associated protein 1 [Neodiprion fabricii]
MLSSRRFLRFTMRYLHDCKRGKIGSESCLRLRQTGYSRSWRSVQTASISSPSTQTDNVNAEEVDTESGVPDEVRQKLLLCEYLDYEKIAVGHKKLVALNKSRAMRAKTQHLKSIAEAPVYSVVVDQLRPREVEKPLENFVDEENKATTSIPVHMPYSGTNKYNPVETDVEKDPQVQHNGLNVEYKELYEKYMEARKAQSSDSVEDSETLDEETETKSTFQLADNLARIPPEWMTDYEEFDDGQEDENWQLNYGTPNPNSEVSSVPCGGCGALLHCKDSAIPGYLPSEIFLATKTQNLKSLTCQRCHFMTHYNTSLAVNVTPEEYPRLLSSIKNKRAAVILMVDLMDFPCSIWPDILSIIGTKRPVFVVGNKVDLLPRDTKKFIPNLIESLSKAIVETGVHEANIKHVSVISAKTGYGVEELINQLHKIWEYKGHVYLIGCTNSGKSTLFNMLLQSDYCKSKAVDLIQRATISPWPGTTLNLLKFPILRPSAYRLSLRAQRLKRENEIHLLEENLRSTRLRETGDVKYAQLIGHMGRTFSNNDTDDEDASNMGVEKKRLGVNIDKRDYKHSHWCFDTPGTIQPDQLLHLLTTDELMATLPKKMIIPRTYIIKPKYTMFLGGLGRLDYFDGDSFIRITVFASEKLPVTMCRLEDADHIYDQLLSTKAFVVPSNDPERLKQWPHLEGKDFEITGVGWDTSAADVILSSAGWVAITPGPEKTANVRGWTPEGRGIHLRTPALLKHSVKLRGTKIRDLPVYRRHKPVYTGG